MESLSRVLSLTPRGAPARALADWILRDRTAFGLDLGSVLREEETGEPLDRLTRPESWGRLRRVAQRAAEDLREVPPDALARNAEALAIAAGLDADLVAFDDDWQIHTVIARGQIMVDAGRPVVRGMFDRIILDQLG